MDRLPTRILHFLTIRDISPAKVQLAFRPEAGAEDEFAVVAISAIAKFLIMEVFWLAIATCYLRHYRMQFAV